MTIIHLRKSLDIAYFRAIMNLEQGGVTKTLQSARKGGVDRSEMIKPHRLYGVLQVDI
jgi:hypothetical protein